VAQHALSAVAFYSLVSSLRDLFVAIQASNPRQDDAAAEYAQSAV
jgi:hypothetical protein